MAYASCVSSRGDTIERIGSAFGLQDFAIADSYLRAHGITIAAQAWNVATNLPHFMGAIGGIPILVPARQARRAAKLLESVQAHPASEPRRPSTAYIVTIALLCIVLTGFGTAPPSSGVVINSSRHVAGFRRHKL